MEREQLLKVMVPVGAFALLLILVAGVVALNSGGGPPATPAVVPPPDGTQPLPPSPADASGAVAKYDFPLDAPEWKEVAGHSGLRYWDVKIGDGKECPPGASVKNPNSATTCTSNHQKSLSVSIRTVPVIRA